MLIKEFLGAISYFQGYFETSDAYYFIWPINNWNDWEIVKILKARPKLMLWEFV